jgi:DNA-binding MarR family transcriptional regulator
MSGPSAPELPDLSAQPLRFLHAYWRVWQGLAARAEGQLEQAHGLDLRAFLALSYLHGGATHPGELAAQLGLPRYVVTRTLDTLSLLKAVQRNGDSHDRRRQNLQITPEGQQLWLAALQTVQQVCGDPLAVLGDHLDPLTAMLETLAATTETALSSLAQEQRP